MARFRYHLQNVLNIKYQMETLAKQEFADRRQALDLEEEKLRTLLEKKEALEQEAVELLQGKLDFRDIDDNQLSRVLCDQRIANQKSMIKKAEDALEQARIALEEAIKDRKIHERLREKAFEEFMLEENRAESKVIDELTTYTYGQKKDQE